MCTSNPGIKYGWSVLGLFCGLAYLTRYIGITLPVTFAIMLLSFEPGWKRKLISLAA